MVKYSDEFPKAEEPTDKDLGWIAKEQADAIKAYPGLWDFLVEDCKRRQHESKRTAKPGNERKC